MGIELLLVASAGFAIFKTIELFSPLRSPGWLMPFLLLLCAYVAHFIPEPWLVYVAASGLIPVLYMLAGGAITSTTPGQSIREALEVWRGSQVAKKMVKTRPQPKSRIGSRIPKI